MVYNDAYNAGGQVAEEGIVYFYLYCVCAIASFVFGIMAWKQADSKLKSVLAVLSLLSAIILIIGIYIIIFIASILLRIAGFGKSSSSSSDSKVSEERIDYEISQNRIIRNRKTVATLEPHTLNDHLSVRMNNKTVGVINTNNGDVCHADNSSRVLKEGRELFNQDYAGFRGQQQADYIARASVWIVENLNT